VNEDPGMDDGVCCSSKAGEVKAVLPDAMVVSSAEAVFMASDVDLVVIQHQTCCNC